MNDKYLLVLILPMILTASNSSFAAESYTEPPQLYKEIELRQQSKAKMAREQAARLAEEQRIIEEQEARAEREKRIAKQKEKEQALIDAEEKRINDKKQREKMAREEEEKRVAKENAAREEEEKRFDEIKSAVAEQARQERLARERVYSSSDGFTSSTQIITHPACVGKDNNLCDAVKVMLVLKGKLCYRVMNIVPLGNDNFDITCELASFDRSLVTYSGKL